MPHLSDFHILIYSYTNTIRSNVFSTVGCLYNHCANGSLCRLFLRLTGWYNGFGSLMVDNHVWDKKLHFQNEGKLIFKTFKI